MLLITYTAAEIFLILFSCFVFCFCWY